MMIELQDFLAEQLADSEVAWSVGTFGAIAEFMRDADEAVRLNREADAISALTGRGGISISVRNDLRPIATEALTAQSWNQRVALCLAEPVCVMARRAVLSEIGPDREALRGEDRGAILFDLGLGTLQLDACVRTDDTSLIAALRRCTGQSLFAPGNGAMAAILAANPHRVFLSRIGRVEVFQPIPPPDGKSPQGPHTHVLPKLLRHNRTHAATEALPTGWVPCAHFYPPHPLRSSLGHIHSFQAERHAAFQQVLNRYGDPEIVDVKRRVVEQVAAGVAPSDAGAPADRFARAAVRVALRQLRATESGSPALAAWLVTHDRYEPDEPNDAAGDNPCTA